MSYVILIKKKRCMTNTTLYDIVCLFVCLCNLNWGGLNGSEDTPG